jgi:hypothetical protein
LPLLDAMIPAATPLAQIATAGKLRIGFFYIPHGAIMGNTSHGPAMDKWTPSGSGADFKLSPIMTRLEPYKNHVISIGNLENDLPNAMGVTPLLAAAGIGTRTGQSVLGPGPPPDVEKRSIETMGILIQGGANVNARITDTTSLTARIARAGTMTNREGQTALYFAAQAGRVAEVKFLLEHGADVNAMGDAGKALLDAAKSNAEITAMIRAAMR